MYVKKKPLGEKNKIEKIPTTKKNTSILTVPWWYTTANSLYCLWLTGVLLRMYGLIISCEKKKKANRKKQNWENCYYEKKY